MICAKSFVIVQKNGLNVNLKKKFENFAPMDVHFYRYTRERDRGRTLVINGIWDCAIAGCKYLKNPATLKWQHE